MRWRTRLSGRRRGSTSLNLAQLEVVGYVANGLDAHVLKLLHRAGVKPRQVGCQPVEADILCCKFALGYSGEIGRQIIVSLESLNCRFHLVKDFLLFSGNIADSLATPYTGLAVVNDGEQPAYDITIHNIQINEGGKLVFHCGQTERLTKSDGEAFYPAFVEMKLGGIFGSGLFDFMRERGVVSIAVPITYRDSSNNWFQTDVILERDVQKSGGLRPGWKQKRIPNPDSENG